MNFDALVAQIEQAFDGVPRPDVGSYTLATKEPADPNVARVADGLPTRWQTLSFEDITGDPWGLARLDAAGMHYYIPAIMTSKLRRLESHKDAPFIAVFEATNYALSQQSPYRLREYTRGRLSRFTKTQRRAVHDFAMATVGDVDDGDDVADGDRGDWSQVIAHDASGAERDWFDVFWPARLKPNTDALIALWLTAFEVDPGAPPSWAQDNFDVERDGYLPFASPSLFQRRLPVYALFVLQHPEDPLTQDLLHQILRVIQPMHEAGERPRLRARLSVLTPQQREAVSGLADACFDDDELRAIWHMAAALDAPDWLDELGPPVAETSSRRRWWLEAAGAENQRLTGEVPLELAKMDLASVAIELELAFDGVPPPGRGCRTLYEAEEASGWGMKFRPDGAVDHRGRWQDLPWEELNNCPSAFAYLKSDGVHYYTPAFLMWSLCWHETEDDASLPIGLDISISDFLTPGTSYELRDHLRQRLERFNRSQRHAIYAYMKATSLWNRKGVRPWARAVAHDESGAAGEWFEAFWPERARPDAADVIEMVRSAFPTDPLAPWNTLAVTQERRVRLSDMEPDEWQRALPAYAVFVLEHPRHAWREGILDEIQRSIHPQWGHASQPHIRARLNLLTHDMRNAVAEFTDACIDNTSMRAMWRRASAHAGPDWFEYLKLP